MINSRAVLFATVITAVILCLFSSSVTDAAAIATMDATTNVSTPLFRAAAEQSILKKRGKKSNNKNKSKHD